MARLTIMIVLLLSSLSWASSLKTITFPSEDGLMITADLSIEHPDTATFIVLFHQAQWSRGEYGETGPILSTMGFNYMAVDQRSGREINGVVNETAKRAKEKGKPTAYADALPDMKAAIDYARIHYAQGKLIIWGSSYSASLVLKIAGDNLKKVDAVLAFAPGEYFARSGKSKTYITDSAKSITCPVFITSAKSEKQKWFSIYEAIPSPSKKYFLPSTEGAHGSRALWKQTPEHKTYWKKVKSFLMYFINH